MPNSPSDPFLSFTRSALLGRPPVRYPTTSGDFPEPGRRRDPRRSEPDPTERSTAGRRSALTASLAEADSRNGAWPHHAAVEVVATQLDPFEEYFPELKVPTRFNPGD